MELRSAQNQTALEATSKLKTCPECCKEYEDTIHECPIQAQALKNDQSDPLIGTRLANRYEIVSLIGKGGMGVVYKARHEVMERPMAIKMLHSYRVAAADAIKRFFEEAQTISQVKHHHIVTLYDFGMSPQAQPFIVMDYLEGSNLKRLVKEHGALSFERTEHILKQVIEALSAAHTRNVVHLDLKPENIVLTEQNHDCDWVTLVDFGLSKLEETREKDALSSSKGGHISGSPPYMSPEQCKGSYVIDSRSDIYSLAIVLYEVLSGKLPFEAKSSIEMLDCQRYGTPMPFNLSQPHLKVCTELTHVLNRALEKEPDRRQQTVEEFGEEVHDAMARDSLKMRTLKHRAEVGSLDGFLNRESVTQSSSEIASVLTHDTALATASSDNVEQTSGSNLSSTALEASELTIRSNNPLFPTDVEMRLVGCPYCDAPIEPDLKFCLNCERQLVSPQDIYKRRGIGCTVGVPKLRSVDHYKGKFSDRAKSGNVTARHLLRVQKALRVVLLLVLVYAFFILFERTNALTALGHLFFGSLQHAKL